MPDWIAAIILGVVEGLTEFIPVSSTGHLIIAGHLIDFDDDRAATFQIFIQLGAILAVVLLYKERFWRLIPTELEVKPEQGLSGLHGLLLLAITTFPALVFGAVSYRTIKEDLFGPTTVAVGLLIGGIAMLLLESRLPPVKRCGLDSITWREALAVGLFQCLALWPGVSRSAATIMGAMLIGIERKTAAEYSFFAAVPTLLAATIYDMYQSMDSLQSSDVLIFAIGFVVAFISAWLAVEMFIRLLATYTLTQFGWYRVVIAALVLLVVI
ncbi:MAG: undecaprenyl-diphosphate phosphatase [Chloroflexi bacterium]|nr:MAG: undecaprenyl-diphosphate phosphatase [Chloroflexota bacterium]